MTNFRFKLQEFILMCLELEPYTRDNDRLLYVSVLDRWGKENGMDVLDLSVREFYTGSPLPDYQSVVRIRRKMQALHPELMGTEKKREYRAEQETDWRNYALGNG